MASKVITTYVKRALSWFYSLSSLSIDAIAIITEPSWAVILLVMPKNEKYLKSNLRFLSINLLTYMSAPWLVQVDVTTKKLNVYIV